MYDSVGGEQAPHKERCRASHAFDNTHQPPRVLSPLTCIAIVQKRVRAFLGRAGEPESPQQIHFLKVDFASCILHSRS
jgi:hypothetical protein